MSEYEAVAVRRLQRYKSLAGFAIFPYGERYVLRTRYVSPLAKREAKRSALADLLAY